MWSAPRRSTAAAPTLLPRRAWVRPTASCASPCHRSRSSLPGLTSRWPPGPRGRGTDDLRPVVAELPAGFRPETGRGRRQPPQLRSLLGQGGGQAHRGDGRCAADRSRHVLDQDSWRRLVAWADWHRFTIDGHTVEPVTHPMSCRRAWPAQASGLPDSSRSRKPASSRIVSPSSCALSALEPAFSPTTT